MSKFLFIDYTEAYNVKHLVVMLHTTNEYWVP